MIKQKRRQFTAEQKAAVLRRHLKDKIPVSDLCDEYKIQPSAFYRWQAQLLENLETALDSKEPVGRAISRVTELERENATLKEKLARKDNVIAEISEEHVALKKELGEL